MTRAGKWHDQLVALARSFGVTEDPGFQILQHSGPLPAASPEERISVLDAIQMTRNVEFEARKHVFHRNAAKTPPSAEEASTMLEDLMSQGCTSGQAAYLIELGADVNISRHKSTSLSKRIRKKEQENIRSDALRRATERGDVGLVRVLLAGKADQSNRDQALGIAIGKRDFEVIKTLILSGANPNFYEAEFQTGAKDGETELVCILSSGTCKPSEELATASLYGAVCSGQLQLVIMLLWLGADANKQNPSALAVAVQSQQISLIAALSLAKRHPSPAHLASMIAELCNNLQHVSAEGLSIVKLLLLAGASGKGVTQSIVRATKRKQQSLLKLLTMYSDFDNEQTPIAIKHAVLIGDTQLFNSTTNVTLEPCVVDEILAYIHTTRSSVTLRARLQMTKALIQRGPSVDAVSEAMLNASITQDVEMVEVLLDAGACGDKVSRALYLAMKNEDRSANAYKIIKMLVDKGANVNAEQGWCIKQSVRNADVKTLELLLAGTPDSVNLGSALSLCDFKQRGNTVYTMSSLLITAGARGTPVHRVLTEVLDGSQESQRFVQLLLREGEADVNFEGGRSICEVVQRADVQLLKFIVNYGPSQQSLNKALSQAIKIVDRQCCLDVCTVLADCDPGISGRSVDEALITIVDDYPQDHALIILLLNRGASIDHDTGHAICITIRRGDRELLACLLNQPAKPEVLIRALDKALKMSSDGKKRIFCSMLLNTSTVLDVKDLGSLLHRTFDASEDVRLLQIFLNKDASVNHPSMQAIGKAITKSNKAALKLLINSGVTAETARVAFLFAWNNKFNDISYLRTICKNDFYRSVIKVDEYLLLAVQKMPFPREHVEYLLSLNASVDYADSQCMTDAAGRLENEALTLLLSCVKVRSSVSKVFERTMRNSNIWQHPAGIVTVDLLLKSGASGDAVHQNLLVCVERYHSHRNAPQVLNSLVEHGASCDFRNGLAFEVAAKTGDLQLIDKLFSSHYSIRTVNNAFPYILESQIDEARIVALIDLFHRRSFDKLDINFRHRALKPVLFLCIERFPSSTDALQRPLQRGAAIDQTTRIVVTTSLSPERVDPVLWSLCQNRIKVDDKLICLLIRSGSDINFTTEISKATSLLMAVKQGRISVAKTLLSHGADSSTADQTRWTPLRYASVQNDLTMMELLLESHAECNGGSSALQ